MNFQDYLSEQRKDPEYLKAEAEMNREASHRYFDLALDILNLIDYVNERCSPDTPISKLIGRRKMKAFRKVLES